MLHILRALLLMQTLQTAVCGRACACQVDQLRPFFTSSKIPEKCTMQKRRFFVTSNLRYMHEVLNIDKIKN
jgi:hypothetical protein